MRPDNDITWSGVLLLIGGIIIIYLLTNELESARITGIL